MKKYRLHPFLEEPSQPETPKRVCNQAGCQEEGVYPAPRSRDQLRDYYWFCLNHVRDYNGQWNYFKNMTEETVEESWRDDMTWQRPSWNFSSHAHRAFYSGKIKDPFGTFETEEGFSFSAKNTLPSLNSKERQAMKDLGLSFPLNEDQLKIRYKILAKKYHPDLNQGCKKSEELFKEVSQAYALLKQILYDASL